MLKIVFSTLSQNCIGFFQKRYFSSLLFQKVKSLYKKLSKAKNEI